MSYRHEFPDFGDMDIAIPEGFKDFSWHNDTCPSFAYALPGYSVDSPRHVRVFIDYADKEKSEHPEFPRFLAYVEDESGGAPDEQFTSNDWAAVLEWMRGEIAKYTV